LQEANAKAETATPASNGNADEVAKLQDELKAAHEEIEKAKADAAAAKADADAAKEEADKAKADAATAKADADAAKEEAENAKADAAIAKEEAEKAKSVAPIAAAEAAPASDASGEADKLRKELEDAKVDLAITQDELKASMQKESDAQKQIAELKQENEKLKAAAAASAPASKPAEPAKKEEYKPTPAAATAEPKPFVLVFSNSSQHWIPYPVRFYRKVTEKYQAATQAPAKQEEKPAPASGGAKFASNFCLLLLPLNSNYLPLNFRKVTDRWSAATQTTAESKPATSPAPSSSKRIGPVTVAEGVRNGYNDVRDDTKDVNWALFSHDETGARIDLHKSGSGGLPELVTHLSSDSRFYGFVRVVAGDELSKRPKFVFVQYVGTSVPLMKKARSTTDKALVKEIIKDFAIEARTAFNLFWY